MRGRKRRNDIASREFDNVVHMYVNENASLKQISHVYDVTAYVVRDLLVGMGVEIGPRGRPRVKRVLRIEEDSLEQPSPLRVVDTITTDHTQDDNALNLGAYDEAQRSPNPLDLGDFRRPLGQ